MSGMELALTAFGYRGFKQPNSCMVLFPDGVWKHGVIVRRWAEVEISSGKRSESFDVSGFDELGTFNGRFDQDHVRIGSKVYA